MNTSAELKKNLKKFRLERDSVLMTSANALRPNPNPNPAQVSQRLWVLLDPFKPGFFSLFFFRCLS